MGGTVLLVRVNLPSCPTVECLIDQIVFFLTAAPAIVQITFFWPVLQYDFQFAIIEKSPNFRIFGFCPLSSSESFCTMEGVYFGPFHILICLTWATRFVLISFPVCDLTVLTQPLPLISRLPNSRLLISTN